MRLIWQSPKIFWYAGLYLKVGAKRYRHRLIQTKLAQAIEEKVIQVHYQPEVDLRTGQVIGFEALARWTDPELGIIPPVEFVAVAEEAHLIDALSMLVVDTVLQDKRLIRERFPQATVALNLAPHVFLGARLLKFLTERVELEPGLLDGLEQWVPDMELIRVPEATHWIVHEQPDRVARMIHRLAVAAAGG